MLNVLNIIYKMVWNFINVNVIDSRTCDIIDLIKFLNMTSQYFTTHVDKVLKISTILTLIKF